MPEQLACTPNCTSLSFPGHQTNAILQVRTSVNAGMAKLVNLGAEMDLPRGGLECAANNENMLADTELQAQGLVQAGKAI